jgi:RNA polymerase sigma factor (sigma-70 family)
MNPRFEAFRNGCTSAFKQYYLEFENRIFTFAKRLGAGELAQDITQDSFAALWNNKSKIQDEGHLGRFLYVVARNFFLQHKRKQKSNQHAELELSYLLQESIVNVDDAEIAVQETLLRLRAAIRNLSRMRRNVVERFFFQGMTISEIADQLGLKDQTVRNHLSGSVIILRRHIQG